MQIQIHVLFDMYIRFSHAHIRKCTHTRSLIHNYFFLKHTPYLKNTLWTQNLFFKTYTYTGPSTGSPLRGGQRLNTAAEDARRRVVAEFERWQRRAVSNIDSLKLFATLKEAYPLICEIQKCLLACPPSQSDCEELFSLLGLHQGIFMYVCIWCHTRIFVTKQKWNILIYTHIYTYTQVCVLPRSKSSTWRTDSEFIVMMMIAFIITLGEIM